MENYQISIDEKWKSTAEAHGDNCTCWRCVRFRTGSEVCGLFLSQYVDWCNRNGLDVKQHQINGLAWCLYHEVCVTSHAGCRGGIIADEMGLGKTILMLGCMQTMRRRNTLIVVPPILLNQWVNIIKKFLGITPFVYNSYHHSNRTAVSVYQLSCKPIVITTYGMLHIKPHHKLLSIRWSRIIFDEGHHMRNEIIKITRGCSQLKSDVRWILTGTPINNTKHDLVSLCDILRVPYRDLACHFLRRTKEEVGIVLPPLHIENVQVDWQCEREELISRQIHAYFNFSKVNDSGEIQDIIHRLRNQSFGALVRMRQMCILPTLLRDPIQRIQEETGMSFSHTLRHTSKLQAVLDKLDKNKNRDTRKLVFCHYHAEMDYIQQHLVRKGISCSIIDGRTSKRDVNTLVTPVLSKVDFKLICKKWHYNSYVYPIMKSFLGPEVLLIQIQTGCEGLNLQHFTEIYFTSPHWNPAVDDQAIARCHRIGQTRPVNVYKFIMNGFRDNPDSISLDNYCVKIQEMKREIMENEYN